MATTTCFWHAADLGEVDLLRADASHHSYARHSHEGYALGMVVAGAHGFAARGEAWCAGPGDAILVNAEEPHDGMPRGDMGYSYRMLYVAPAVFAAAMAELTTRRRPFFPRPVVQDRQSARMIGALHRLLETSRERLERETRFLELLVGLARRHTSEPPPTRHIARHRVLVDRTRQYLDAQIAGNPSLGDLARVAGTSRFHLLRLFRREIGLSPHAWLMQRRLHQAKRLLRAARRRPWSRRPWVFADQSHLTRRFLGTFGTTPGRYRRQSNTVQFFA